ncbi:histidine transporter, partial [Staphylococcus nepalensis]
VKVCKASTSISAISFFAEMVPCILATDIKIPIGKLTLIWFIRVALTLLIAIPFALLIF